MPARFERLRRGADSPDIATYRALRAAGKSWFAKIMRHPANKRFDIVKAAKKLMLSVQGRTIVFEDETDSAILADYYLFDYRPAGKSLAETCEFPPGELTPLEAEVHEAKLASHTSLFEVAALHDEGPKILLRDRLNKDTPELWLTDLALSESFRRNGARVLMFTRIVSLHGVHMTGGFAVTFDPKYELALVDGYRREMWSVPLPLQAHRRTIYFLRLGRKFGHPSAYADVVPPAPRGSV